MPCHQRQRMVQIAVALVALFDHPHPEGALFCSGPGHRLDHWQRQLRFLGNRRRYSCRWWSTSRRSPRGHRQSERRYPARRHRCAAPAPGARHAGDDAAHFGRGRKKGGRLATDHLQIGIFGGGQILCCGQLQNLTFGDDGAGIGQDVENPKRAGFHHQLEAAKKVIADQNRTLFLHNRLAVGRPLRR